MGDCNGQIVYDGSWRPRELTTQKMNKGGEFDSTKYNAYIFIYLGQGGIMQAGCNH